MHKRVSCGGKLNRPDPGRGWMTAMLLWVLPLASAAALGPGCAAPEKGGMEATAGVPTAGAPVYDWDFARVDRISKDLSRSTFRAASVARGRPTPRGAVLVRLDDCVRSYRLALKKHGDLAGTTPYFTRVLIAQRDVNRDLSWHGSSTDVWAGVASINQHLERLRLYYPANEWKNTGAVR